MNFEDARAAVYARLKATMAASYPTVPVIYENRVSVDLDDHPGPVVTCQMAYADGEQVSMSQAPIVRYRGAIYLTAECKQGQGTAAALTMLGVLAGAFKTASFGGVVTKAPRPLPGAEDKGWYVLTLRVPFYFDDIPA